MLYIELLCIEVIVCCVVDLSGFISSVKHFIWRFIGNGRTYVDFGLKPIDCSLCMSWWSMLVYLFIVGECSIMNVAIILVMSLFAEVISIIIQGSKDLILLFIRWLGTLVE